MKTKTLSIRLNAFDTETLKYICDKYDVSEADAVRKGIELLKEWDKEESNKKGIDNMLKLTKAEVVVNDHSQFWEVYIVTEEIDENNQKHINNADNELSKYSKRFKRGEFEEVKKYASKLCKDLNIEFNELTKLVLNIKNGKFPEVI